MPTTIAARANLDLIDQNYTRWRKDPASVDPSWSAFFEGFELGNLPGKQLRLHFLGDGEFVLKALFFLLLQDQFFDRRGHRVERMREISQLVA